MSLRFATFLPVVLALGVAVQTPAQLITEQAAYYEGFIGGTPVTADFAFGDTTWTGTYTLEPNGVTRFVEGSVDYEGAAQATIAPEQWTEDPEAMVGQLEGSFTPLSDVFEGRITRSDGVAYPVRFEAAVRYATRRYTEGRIELSITYPHFLDNEPALQGLNTALSAAAAAGIEDLILQGRAEKDSLDADLAEFFRWSSDERWSVRHASPNLVSLLSTGYWYTGGAHGNIAFESMTFAFENGRPRALRLADVFTDASTFVEMVSSYCLGDLKRQEAPAVMDGSVTAFTVEDLQAFSLHPAGLTIHFAPYAVGPWAAGSYEVLIPADELRDLVTPQVAALFE
ncbi:MAG: DUF3298 and DUF4163 domain-containing protein [Bacteroidota bacterium]